VIPPVVAAELKAHPDSVALAAIDTAIRDQWLRIAAPQNTALHRMLLQQVHRGEAEAIALAADLKADTIIIDEQR
jgi:predicted nucleic acid-binding protein